MPPHFSPRIDIYAFSRSDPADVYDITGQILMALIRICALSCSSHILSEVSETCDDVIFLNHGEVLKIGNMGEITRSFNTNAVKIEFVKNVDDDILSRLRELKYDIMDSSGRTVTINYSGDEQERAQILINAIKICPVISYTSAGSDLEKAYISILGEK